MTQQKIIDALANGPLTSHEVANLTGMPQATVLSTAKKLRSQGRITTKIVKSGKYNLAQFTLVEEKQIPMATNGLKIICGVKTYGIFTPAEYKIMNAQARRLYGVNPTFAKKQKAAKNENC
jgi:hypothetical protein